MLCLRNCFLPAVMLAVCVNCITAQNAPVAASVQQFRDQGGRFEPLHVFQPAPQRHITAVQFVPSAQFLTLDVARLTQQINQDPTALSLQLPYGDETLTLDLIEAPVLTEDFSVVTSISDSQPVAYVSGKHYRGIVRGQTRSVVAISLLESGMMGLICDDQHGNLVLGKLEKPGNTSDYILYSDREVAYKPAFPCQALEHDAMQPEDRGGSTPDVNGCVRVYFEADYELFQNKGSVQATVDYLAGAFNQVATLYANEQISTTLSQIFVWVTPDNYSTSSSSSALTQFRSLRKSYNGDLAHLVGIGGNNLGGIAYLDVLCVPSYAYAFSDISTSYSSVPTYSWTVEVLTHEMGHNLGSPHTQSCTWPGGAIDNCFTTEGGCPAGPAPVNGGTIMSYCHLTNYGINFNNGFGPLPGDKIRTEVGNAACLSGSCAPAGSCLAPKSLAVANINGSNATVSWNAVSGATGYNLQWRAVGALSWTTLSNVSSPCNITGLPASDEIEVQVQTVCSGGASPYSYGVVFISSSGGGGGGTSCGTPANLTATATSSSSALVTWGAVSGASSYQLSYKSSGSSVWGTPVSLSTTSYTINGLNAATTYDVRVSANCSGIVSAFASTTFTTSGSNGTTCNTPGNLSAVVISSSAANISWSAVSGASYYQLYYKAANSVYWSSPLNLTGTAYALSGLKAGTSYNVRVRTVCSSGSSGFANTTFTTQSSGGGGSICATPTNLAASNVTATSAIISWNPVSGAAGYDLQIKLASSSSWMTFLNLPTTIVQITNMQPGKTYQARVRTRCQGTNNYSNYTNILNITTPSNVIGDETQTAQTNGDGIVIPLESTVNQPEVALSVWPNPAHSWATVEYHLSEDSTQATVDWFDINGRLLSLQAAQSDQNVWKFDLSTCPAGVYFVRVSAGGQEPAIRKVVKQ